MAQAPLATPTPEIVPPRLQKVLDQIQGADYSALPEAEVPAAKQAAFEMLTAAEVQKLRDTDQLGGLQAWISQQLQACKSARQPEERQWYKNLAMYLGQQFSEWDPNQRRMRERPAPAGEPRLAVNFIQPVVRTEIAKTSSSHPSATVLPASNDEQDIQAARAGEQVWEWWYDTSKWHTEVFNPQNFWRSISGMGFVKTYYDHTCEDPAGTAAAERAWSQAAPVTPITDAPSAFGGTEGRESNEELEPSFARFAEAIPQPKPEKVKGLIKGLAVTPFHLYVPDLAETSLQRQPYLLHAYLLPRETAMARYAEFLPDDFTPTAVSPSAIVDLARLGVEAQNPADADAVMIVEAWLKPGAHRALPEGGLVVTMSDQIVAISRTFPYEHGEFPFAMSTGVETGKFYRQSVIVPLIPLQNEMNRTYAQLIKYKNITTSPMFWYRKGAFDPTRIRVRPGTFVPVNLGYDMPVPVPIQAMPAYVTDLIDRIKAAVDDISGQHQVSRAIAPGADTAASAISILREADDDYLSPTIDSIEAMTETVARHVLSYAKQFWDQPRLVKVTGAVESFSAQILDAADLANSTDIRIDTGSGMPQIKSARIATITEWMDKKYITPEVGLKAIEGGSLGKVYKLLQIDETQAERENVKMQRVTKAEYDTWQAGQLQPALPPAQPGGFSGLIDPTLGLDGTQVDPLASDPAVLADPAMQAAPPIMFPVNDFDNHAVHIDVIERWMKSAEFETYEDWRKQLYLDHRAAHIAGLQQQMATQQMMADNLAASTDAAAGARGEVPPSEQGSQPSE